eukprot:UN13278
MAYMCDSPTSGASGTDHGCFYYEDCLIGTQDGFRVCPDGTDPYEVPSSCMNEHHNIVYRNTTVDPLTITENPGVYWLDDGALTIYVVGPNEHFVSSLDSYVVP